MPTPQPRRSRRIGATTLASVVALLALAGAVLPTSASASVAPAVAAARSTPFRATGWFRIGKLDGRWFFVTPTGQPFYSAGVDHVDPAPDTDRTTGQCPYCQAIADQYPSTAAWATATVAQLRSWGFNSLGAFTDETTLAGQMPYSVQLDMASGDDWFDPSFVTHADAVAASQVAPRADDPDLIGWYTDSELDWGPSGDDLQTQLDHYLALPEGSPGRTVADQYVGNPNGFVYALATRYFQVTTAAVHAYDPHHLILGVKAEGQEIQPELLEAAQPYVDVFSVDDYTLMPGFAQIIDKIWPQYLPVTPTFDNFVRYVKRPIMVAEYSFIAHTPQTPDTVPGVYAVYADQQARADAYTSYIAPFYEQSPWVVGDEWFEYVDEPAGGRFDGEDDNFGLVDVENQPYPELTQAASVLHSIAPDHVVAPGPSCDDWARTSSGVTCTATLDAASYPLELFTSTLSPATTGVRGSTHVVAIGGRPTYRFALAPGTVLPAGLSFDPSDGRLYGVPRRAGTYALTVTVTDSSSPAQTVTGTVSLTVAAASP